MYSASAAVMINAARLGQKRAVSLLSCYRLKHWKHGPSFAPAAPGGRNSRSAVSRNEDPDEIRARVEEAEKLQDWMQFNEHNHSQTSEFVNREASKMKQVLIRKIIERKYFKSPQETNLLTWAAKEQIRYLHAEFPDEWTTERIAASFPISEQGVKKILNSKCTPKSAEEISKHDQRVQKHWLALNQGARSKGNDNVKPGGPLTLGNDKSNSPSLVAGDERAKSATAGMLSSGLEGDILNDANNSREPPGLFESIVKDYCEKTRGKNASSNTAVNEINNENLVLGLPDHEENLRLGSGGTSGPTRIDELRAKFKSMSPITSSKETERFGRERNGRTSLLNVDFDQEREKDFVENRRTRSRKYDEKYDDDRQFHDDEEFDDVGDFRERAGENARTSEDRSTMTRSILGRKRRGLAGSRIKDDEIIPKEGDVQLYAMKGTRKITENARFIDKEQPKSSYRNTSRDRFTSEYNDYKTGWNDGKIDARSVSEEREVGFKLGQRQNEDNCRDFSERISENKYKNSSATVYDQIRFDSPGASSARGRLGGRTVEAYIYDSEKGYSHPFGRRSNHPDPRVDVNKARAEISRSGGATEISRSGGATFRKGNAYYDEDGELLFRTP